MSASLVGSEMCIRDRQYTAHNAQRQQTPQHTTCDVQHTAQSTEHPHTVSYTHLTLPTICSV
eukprot:4223366-Alexandrium_andersonii.AAC.1